MSSLSEVYIKLETIEKIATTLQKKGEKGIGITISISDETNEYGQNVSSFVAQKKEDRDAGKKKFYVGNGKCFWTDGKITIAEKRQQQAATSETKINESAKNEEPPF